MSKVDVQPPALPDLFEKLSVLAAVGILGFW
jgi:hypothetical protein